MSAPLNLSRESIDAGIGYCRCLREKMFHRQLEKMAPGLPRHRATVRLDGGLGERVYDQVRRHIASNRVGGGVLTSEGEVKAVQKFLLDLKGRTPAAATPIPAASRSAITRAKLQLARVEKFLSNGRRTIRGLANSGKMDRVGDIVDPRGGAWTLPVPLLWQHRHDEPIGWVRSIEARADGLWISAELAEGIGKSDQAWQMIEAGLVDSYSIGFHGRDWSPLAGGGKRFTDWELVEVSVVTIPADPAAKIARSSPVTVSSGRPRISLVRSPGVRLVAP